MKIWCTAYVVAAWWCVARAEDCDVTIGDDTYREEILVSAVPKMRSLAVDLHTHNAYFTFINPSTGMYENVKVNLLSKAVKIVKELSGPCWYSVDQRRGKVHAGCSTHLGAPGGLYTLDSNTGRFELAGELGRDIPFVFYNNDQLYYSYNFNNTALLRKFTDGRSVLMSAPARELWELAVDARGDFIFSNSSGTYRWRKDSGDEARLEIESWAWAMAVDDAGSVHTCDSRNMRGIWRVDDGALTATRLLNVPCKALAFDADGNIVYGDIARSKIVRLVKC